MDLGESTTVTGVIVQGLGTGSQYVRTFSVKYSDTGESDDWQSVTDEEGETINVSKRRRGNYKCE